MNKYASAHNHCFRQGTTPPYTSFMRALSPFYPHRHQVPIHHEAVLFLIQEHERRLEQCGQRGHDREGERGGYQGGHLQLRFDYDCVSKQTTTGLTRTQYRTTLGIWVANNVQKTTATAKSATNASPTAPIAESSTTDPLRSTNLMAYTFDKKSVNFKQIDC